MSADNYILIKEYKDAPRFRVSMECASCDFEEQENPTGFDTLEEAVRYTNKYMQEWADDGFPVEYGMVTSLLP